MSGYKYCFVPQCRNTTVTTPEKLFISVPKHESLRQKWFNAVKRDVSKESLSLKSTFYCCEDHFNVEKDVDNLQFYRFTEGTGKIRLKPGVLPRRIRRHTEEASETETRKPEPIPVIRDLKEQMFLDKLNSYKHQLKQLIDGYNSEYNRRVKKLDLMYKERLRLNQIWKEYQIDITEKDFIAEKKAATKDLEEKIIELKENLIADLEEKRKLVENERYSLEISGDSIESKPAMTRKLRRRPNDPIPIPEKRRGKMTSILPSSISFLLDEKEIESDLKAIMRGIKSGVSVRKPANGLQALGPIIPDPPTSEIRIEDGKLLYDKKWFHRGQTVHVEGKDLSRFAAVISAIGTEAISVKKTSDSSKMRIYISQLVRGKITIKRRAS